MRLETTENDDILLHETPGNFRIVLDDVNKQIVIEDRTGRLRLCVRTTDNSISLESEVDMQIIFNGEITLIGGQGVLLQSNGQIRIEGRAGVDIKTPNLLNLESTGVANLTSAQTLTIEGSLVKIN